MAKCMYCGKGVTFGNNVSHSNRKTSRTWKPNIRKVSAVVNGTHKTVAVCSRCLRAGKVERVWMGFWKSLILSRKRERIFACSHLKKKNGEITPLVLSLRFILFLCILSASLRPLEKGKRLWCLRRIDQLAVLVIKLHPPIFHNLHMKIRIVRRDCDFR